MPMLKGKGKALPLILGGKVDDAGGASCDFCLGSCIKPVSSHGSRHLQIHVGMRVNEPGKQ